MCTCAHAPHHNPLHCLLPPHLLEKIAQNAGGELRQLALENLSSSGKFRGNREVMGELMGLLQSGGDQKRRTVYDAKGKQGLPGARVRGEGDPASSDPAVNEAYDGAGATYDLYKNVYGRNSIDGKGMRLDSTVHHGRKYDNAFWNGRQMVYGDGDGQLFNRFTIAIDVIGHELTHGVTQYSAGLVYQDQPGALNESMSDVFGCLVKQYAGKNGKKTTAKKADWLIGEGLLAKGVKGVALRSMKAPGTAYDDPILGKDPQPAHMKDYDPSPSDNGGVHVNSGIPNHAFYLVAMALGGNAWDRAGKIWYQSLLRFQPTTDFQGAAEITAQTAGTLYGAGSVEVKAVVDAWKHVGITI